MKQKIIGFSVLTFLAFFASAMINTQAIPFLSEVGYSPSQRGNIMAFYAFVSMIGQFIVGYLCDRHKTVKRYFILMVVLTVGFVALTFSLEEPNYVLHFLLMSGALALGRIICNLVETWLIEVDGMYPYFGSIRSLGSLGWGVASLIAGYVILWFGYKTFAYVSIAINLIVIAISFFMEDADKKETRKISLKDTATLFKNKNFVLLIVIFVLVFIVYNADSIIVTDLILSVGGSEVEVGQKWFVQAMSEFPIMLMGTFMLRKLKGKLMLFIGTLFLGIRFVLYGLFPSTTAIIFISVLQMISFPFILLSQKELTLIETPKELRTTGQMVFISFTSGLSAVIAPVITGYLGEMFKITNIVMGLGIFLIVPFLLTFLYKPSLSQNEE